jgi:hypothetical protein
MKGKENGVKESGKEEKKKAFPCNIHLTENVRATDMRLNLTIL